MKKILKPFNFIIEIIQKSLTFICSTISKGFFFYFYAISNFLSKFFRMLRRFFREKQADPHASFSLISIFIIGVFTYTYIYNANDKVLISVDINNSGPDQIITNKEATVEEQKNSIETNLFRRYGATSLENINFKELKDTNKEVIGWLIVDGTNINYPIVQTEDNDYYLKHNINQKKTTEGWPFMDYRNDKNMTDNNTILYGHNLLNKTNFGSVSNIFTKKWQTGSNHKIIYITENKKYIYEVFSIYYSEPVTDYLQTSFYDDNSYIEFLNNLKKKSKYNFKVNVTSSDKIITLSTCTDDNKGRKVVHAKLVTSE